MMGPLQAKAIAVTALRALDFEQLKLIANCHEAKIAKRWALEQFEDRLDELLGLDHLPQKPGQS